MVKLSRCDIRTTEVLDWTGLHVLHHPISSCSQKLRIFLALKGLAWRSHVIDVPAKQNLDAWFLGINPRGLVPVLVHDGDVHIESNDILLHLEALHPLPALIPPGTGERMAELLRHENALHLDLRALSFRFVFDPPGPPKSADDLVRYATAGSGTVNGVADPALATEIEFWERYNRDGQVTDGVIRAAAGRFRAAFAELDAALESQPFLFGTAPTLVDIAWFIYVNRLTLAGYPVAQLHPRLATWFDGLCREPAFAAEAALPPDQAERLAATRRRQAAAGETLAEVAMLAA